jgi:hypothetical protein
LSDNNIFDNKKLLGGRTILNNKNLLSNRKINSCENYNFHGCQVSEKRFWELVEKASCIDNLEKELFLEKGINLDCPKFIARVEKERKKQFNFDFTEIFV